MRLAAGLALATAMLAGGCRPTPPPDPTPRSADAAALRAFELARLVDPADEELDALFGPDESDSRRAALLDALTELSAADNVRVLGEETLTGLGMTAIDLEAELPGGGSASYTVHAQPREGETWQVAWLAGPDVEWPPPQRTRGTGLSTSAHRPPGERNPR